MKWSYFAKQCSIIEGTSSRLAITELVAQLLKEASGEEISMICYLLLGRIAPLFDNREFGIADKFMIKAIAKAVNKDSTVVEKEYERLGDLGTTIFELVDKSVDETVSISNVYHALVALTGISGDGAQEQKIQSLAHLLSQLDPLSARFVVRIPLGKLRLGFSDMTILDALSWMLSGDKRNRDVLEQAYSVRPDIGFVARMVKDQGIAAVASIRSVVSVPIISCLCQRIPTAQEMIDKMGTVSVEPKFDGVRVQIHGIRASKKEGRSEDMLWTYSRNLELTTAMFPELEQIFSLIHADSFILDGEAVGVDPITGKILPFQETTTRKRKHDVAEAAVSVPLRFYLFDMLHKDGVSLLDRPLLERRKILETSLKEQSLVQLAPHIVTSSPGDIVSYHKQQLDAGLEGVVVKKWDGLYEAGRRGYNWVKLKEEEGKTGKLSDTVDAVVMGYYRGEGKRNSFGIGALLVGIKSGEDMVTLTKIGTGVSDELWKELRIKLESSRTETMPTQYLPVAKSLIPHVWVIPKVVVEIAGDDLTVSKIHGAGYAIRFPRLIKVREDKSVQQITTIEEIKTLYNNQF